MKRFALIAMLTAVSLYSIAEFPAGAAPNGAFVISGTATLNGTPKSFPCTGVTCLGTFAGTGNGRALETNGNKQIACRNCLITAHFKYHEPGASCVANTPIAPTGAADGNMTIDSKPTSINTRFAWTRVGVTAVVTLSQALGVAVAGFVPPRTCSMKRATIVGVAVFV